MVLPKKDKAKKEKRRRRYGGAAAEDSSSSEEERDEDWEMVFEPEAPKRQDAGKSSIDDAMSSVSTRAPTKSVPVSSLPTCSDLSICLRSLPPVRRVQFAGSFRMLFLHMSSQDPVC